MQRHARVAPGILAACGVTQPQRADANARHETDPAVHGQQLAVVAVDPTERTQGIERVEGANLAACFTKRLPEVCPRLAEAAHPVVQRADLHACAGAFRQCRDERLADFVVPENIVREQYIVPCTCDGFEPGVEVRACIDEQIHAIAIGQRRAGRARECLFGQCPEAGVPGLARVVHAGFHGVMFDQP